ncbi:MAG: hypothetical protein ACYDH6_24625 [Acidimicrobiales bacterium]
MTEGPDRVVAAAGRGRHYAKILVALAATSYLTTFARERFIYQRALGHDALDRAIVVLAVGSIIGTASGVVASLAWLAGRAGRPRYARTMAVCGCGAGTLAMVAVPPVGLALALVVASGAYEVGRQRAAVRGRQHVAWIGAALAVVPSLAVWSAFGTRDTPQILWGYAAGALFQAAVSCAAGRGAVVRPAARRDSLGLPAVYVGAVLANAFSDRFLLTFVGVGWTASSAFAYNVADACTIVVAGPLAAEAMAGRLPSTIARRTLLALTGATAAAIAITPVALRTVMAGGSVAGENLHRITILTMTYLAGVPGSIVWLFRSRVDQRRSVAWRRVALIGVGSVAVHLAVSSSAAATSMGYGVPAGWLLATYGAAWVVTRGTRPTDPDGQTRSQLS